jgi:hypothetical protein
MERAGDILKRVCPCGGDPSGPMHEESLLHRSWLLGEGLRNHDPLEQPDRRHLRERIGPVDDTHYLRRGGSELR